MALIAPVSEKTRLLNTPFFYLSLLFIPFLTFSIMSQYTEKQNGKGMSISGQIGQVTAETKILTDMYSFSSHITLVLLTIP